MKEHYPHRYLRNFNFYGIVWGFVGTQLVWMRFPLIPWGLNIEAGRCAF